MGKPQDPHRKGFPNKRYVPETDEDRSMLAKALDEVTDAYRQEKVRSDDELVNRLNEYFEKCRARESVPTVEEMCLYVGYDIGTVFDWQTKRKPGFSQNTSEIIKKAKNYMQTLDGKLALDGQINFLAYCFRAKNYYGMVDKVEHVITPTQPYEQIDTKTIKERYQLNMSDIIDSDTKKD